MSAKKKLAKGSTALPALGGFLLLVLLVILMAPSNTIAYENYYDATDASGKVVSGKNMGKLADGEYASCGDIVNITATNRSSGNEDDRLVVDIFVLDDAESEVYSVTWGLNFTGSGSDFSGNITLKSTQASNFIYINSGHVGISLKVDDGYNISVKKHSPPYTLLYHFHVDCDPPVIELTADSDDVTTYKGENFGLYDAPINLSITDSGSDYEWFTTAPHVNYSWDGKTWTNWTGDTFNFTKSYGLATLKVNATDEFGHYTLWERTYMISRFLSDDLNIDTKISYHDTTVVVQDILILPNGALTLNNCSLVFDGDDNEINILDSGKLNIIGPHNNSGSRIVSDGKYTIVARRSSSLLINNTYVDADPNIDFPSTFDLKSGKLDKVHVDNLREKMVISRANPSITSCRFDLKSSSAGIKVDTDHFWSRTPAKIVDTVINGTSEVPLSIDETSVYRPYDTGDLYYADNKDVLYNFTISHAGMSDPYMVIPYFVDSNYISARFTIRYYDDGSWTSLASMYDDTTGEWVNGEDAVFDLSGLPSPLKVSVMWNITGVDTGCAYMMTPLYGDRGMEDGPKHVNPSVNEWTGVNGPALEVRNVTIKNGSRNFVRIHSSGHIDISELILGQGENYNSKDLIMMENGTATIHDCQITAKKDTHSVIRSDFSAGNDWARSSFYGLNIGGVGYSTINDIIYNGGSLSINSSRLSNASIALVGDDCLMDADNITLDSKEYGLKWDLPPSYPVDVTSSLNEVEVTNFTYGGISINGELDDYSISIQLSGFSIKSPSNMTHERDDGIGAVVIDVDGKGEGRLDIGGEFSKVPGHGVAVIDWPDKGDVYINRLNGTGSMLDSIYYWAKNDLYIGESNLGTCGGYGLFTRDGSHITTYYLNINGCDGGVYTGNETQLDMNWGLVRNVTGNPGIEIGENCMINLTSVEIGENLHGVKFGQNNILKIHSCEIKISNGYGVYGTHSNVTIGKSGNKNTVIQTSGKDGLFLEGGNLIMDGARLSSNNGNGVTLWNVEIDRFNEVSAIDNFEDGISIYLGDVSVLEDGHYGPFDKVVADGNGMMGVVFSRDPTEITSTVEISMKDPVLGNNGGYDFFAPKVFHIEWNLFSGKIGSRESFGMVRGNIDIEVRGLNAEFRNTNMTLLGYGNVIHLERNAVVKFINCYLTSEGAGNTYQIQQDIDSSLSLSGSYLGNMNKLTAQEANLFMDDTLVISSNSGLELIDSDFSITNSRFENSGGKGISIHGGGGLIEGATFYQNTYGIWVNGLDEALTIEESKFTENDWGLYLFNTSDMMVEIYDSDFHNNGISSIWADKGYAVVVDSVVDIDDINVKSQGYHVNVSYTLRVEVLDEEGKTADYDLKITRGTSVEQYSSSVNPVYESVLLSYSIIHEDELGSDYSNVTVEMTYEDGTDSRTFTLDHPVHIVFNGFKAPDTTSLLPGQGRPIILQEDIGGTVNEDITQWFDDTPEDRANLVFTADRVSKEIIPHMDGKRLWIELEENWFGEGMIQITATDPHGMSTTVLLPVFVEPQNDPPEAKNPRIVVEGSVPPSGSAFSGDTIVGIWDFHDIDGDNEYPSSTLIRWYRNGELVQEKVGSRSIEDVMAGEVWNFTLIPRDQNGSFGKPVHSPPIIVQNLAPSLEGVSFKNKNARTEDEIIAYPVGPSDPESETLIFHYMWEIQPHGYNTFQSIGAADSPILSPSFTSKGDLVRVTAWVSDGYTDSEVHKATITIENTKPVVHSAEFSPEVVDETTEVIRVRNIEYYDADGDDVTFQYEWYVNGVKVNPISLSREISKDLGKWTYPLRSNITVVIIPYDDDNEAGKDHEMTTFVTPRDTDGDGLFDDANGNGINDGEDDRDDDNDGFSDEIELNQKPPTDPKDPFSKPADTDGDGMPDGDASNSAGEKYMDLDDDNDGIPDNQDTYPLNPALPGDLDGDGVGDDKDNDIDGDGVLNKDDWYPRDPDRSEKPEEPASITAVEWLILIMVLIILIVVIVAILVYLGVIELPQQAPPPVSEPEEGREAIIEEETVKKKEVPEIDEEELDNLSVCSECGELIDIDEDTCPNCGAVFDMDEE